MLLPEAWGCGYAAEACAAALAWFAGALPREPVVLCTQTANDSSMRLAAKLGFTEVERFEKYGTKQWFGVCGPRSHRPVELVVDGAADPRQDPANHRSLHDGPRQVFSGHADERVSGPRDAGR
jgi:RimJ/RimL family protein N-acetyltransferase